jgi:phosphoglycerol transferase MdoB-like AlkP superfamily enzyme
MLYHWNEASSVNLGDWFAVIWHGLPMDLSTAGYFTVLPGLLLVFSFWVDRNLIPAIANVYSIVILFIVSVIFVSDLVLYSFWGFRIDSTSLFYLSSPKDAFASVSVWMLLAGVLAITLCFTGVYLLFRKFVLKSFTSLVTTRKYQIIGSLVQLLVTALLFIPIRGGFTVSTMNVGNAYFSECQFINHSAVNPVFNFMESVMEGEDFANQYRFMEHEKAHQLFNALKEEPASQDSIPSLLNQQKPNIVFFILESFMSKDLEVLGGLPVAKNLNELSKNGVLFTRFFANSFRTDRGVISILSGYPAQPTASIMKYANKTRSLPSIQGSLKKAGYTTSYYYGGDANFTNMRSYLLGSGIEHLVSDKDFPLKERMSKWGAPDHVLIRRLLDDLKNPPTQPFITVVQTLSSHEPFDVPMKRFEDPYLNSVAYTDSCLGVFVEEFRRSPLWNNTLLVFVPDHAMRYPSTLENTDPNRYKIPLILAGGAIRKPMKIDRIGGQIDIAATLLSQLKLPHSDFTFSKNLLNTRSPEFAFFSFVDGFGFVTPESQVVYDNVQKKVVHGNDRSSEFMNGKAFLQCLYDDLSKR